MGRFPCIDPLAERFAWVSPYNYAENEPVGHVDLWGLQKSDVSEGPIAITTDYSQELQDSKSSESIVVYVFDQRNQPTDNYLKAEYTALIFVEIDGWLYGPYMGSSYPDSRKNERKSDYNKVDEGAHYFNNKSGHRGGTQKGLNIVDETGRRLAQGHSPKGNRVVMKNVNVHTGYKTRRYSQGCITICPADWDNFTEHFDWSKGGTKGDSKGIIEIYRGGHQESLEKLQKVLERKRLQDELVEEFFISNW